MRPICSKCNKNPCEKSSNGKGFRHLCCTCRRPVLLISNSYRRFLAKTCENCGFIPVHKCQLEIDHIDGNHKNNSKENLQTLCACCHSLKTYAPQEYKLQPHKGRII